MFLKRRSVNFLAIAAEIILANCSNTVASESNKGSSVAPEGNPNPSVCNQNPHKSDSMDSIPGYIRIVGVRHCADFKDLYELKNVEKIINIDVKEELCITIEKKNFIMK